MWLSYWGDLDSLVGILAEDIHFHILFSIRSYWRVFLKKLIMCSRRCWLPYQGTEILSGN